LTFGFPIALPLNLSILTLIFSHRSPLSLCQIFVICTGEDLHGTVLHTLRVPFAQVAGNGKVLTRRNSDGTERTGTDAFTAADAEIFMYQITGQRVVSLNGIGRTCLLAGRIGTLSAGDRVIDEFGFERYNPDPGKGRVKDFVVGKRTDQFAHPAP